MTAARLWVLAAALCFSTGGTAIKLSGLSGWQISSLRSAVAVVLLTALMPAWRKGWTPAGLAVGAAFGATLVLFVIANTLTTAANAIFLQYTSVLYLLTLGPTVLGEPNRRGDYPLVLLLAAGMALLFIGQDAPSATAPDPALGNWIGAASGVTWAVTLMGLRWLSVRSSGDDLSGAAVISGNAIACLVCLPMALPFEPLGVLDWGIVLYLGSVQIALAYVCLVRGVKQLRALEVTLLLLLEPIASALWSGLVHGEVPSWPSASGCALILAGLTVQALRDGRER